MRRFFPTLIFCSAAMAQTADLEVTNARIYTVDPRHPRASAIAVRQGSIEAVGDDVSRYIGPSTTVIDAKGATIIPGFIDSHGHVRDLGEMLEQIDLRGLTSEAAAVDKVRNAVRQLKPGEWILGQSWDQNLWQSKQFPTADLLSRAAPDNPVSLSRVDGHAVWVNRRALALADINAATPDPPGGRILRDTSGQPTGVLIDNAQSLIARKIPPASPEQIEQLLLRAMQECARLGLTTVHDAGVPQGDIDGYRSLIRKGQLPVRVYAMLAYSAGPKLLDTWLARGPEIGDYLTVRSIKMVSDGALGSRGAATRR